MENASKALIIAGAILLSILIISLGIMIYRQAAGVVDGNQMEELEIQTFNAKFTQYTGSNVKAVVVRTMFDQINAVKASGKTVKVVRADGESEVQQADIVDGSTYRVTANDTNNDGYIDQMKVVVN